jgi:hypothetical protein
MWRIDTSKRVGSTIIASIRSFADDRCLIFSNNGHDVRPSLHRWTNVPNDSLYCGLGLEGPTGLMHNGQGLFTFTRVSETDDGFHRPLDATAR